MILPNWLKKRAELSPNRIAIMEDEKEYTFAQLLDDVEIMSGKLSTLGLKKGEHVALALRNTYDSVVMIHAMQSLGIVMVLLNTRLTAKEMAWQIKDSNSKLFIYDELFTDKANQVKSVGSFINKLAFTELKELPFTNINLLSEFDLNDTHTIIYTSGTTGNPKGVMLTNGNHWWSATGSVLNLGLDAQDRWLACLPLFHVSGLSILMRSVIYGISIVLHEGFEPKKVNRAIIKQNVTIISVVSVMLQRMIDELGGNQNQYPSSLRCVLLGGGPAPKPLLEECRDKNIPVFQTYGMTETASQIVTLAPEYMLSNLGSAGKPLFPSQLRIEKDSKEVDINVIGEIVVKGPNVTSGYYQRVDKTKEVLKDGWLYTGDLGYLDQDGFLFVVDRRNDLIISGGENIYPAEIESVLMGYPTVKEAGVTGISHEKWGQVPIAFVVSESSNPVSEQELKDFCEQHLARYKIPQRFYIIDELPRNASNKLMRRKLLELIPNVIQE